MKTFVAPSFVGYRRGWVRPDLVAGLTVWAVLVPEALAYATIAGVPPVVGLYAAIPALILYAAAGSSRHLVVGPMSATAALSAAIVAPLAGADGGKYAALTAVLAIATGIAGLLAGLLRLGFIASFISEPVLKGFIVGLALTIIIGQVPALLGVEKEHGNFFEQAWGVVSHLGDIDWGTLVVGVLSLVVVLGFTRWLPLVPGSLLAVLLGIAAVAVFGLDGRGVDIVGHIDSGLPSVGLPDGVGFDDYIDLLGPAVGVLLIGFAEGLGAAKTYAAKEGYEVDANRELLGLGTANLGSGLCSGMVVNGSLSKTAVNGGAGAKSQVNDVVGGPHRGDPAVPHRTVRETPRGDAAAVVIAAVIELVDVALLRRLWRVRAGQLARAYPLSARADFVGAAASLVGVLVFETLPGLVIGIAVSLVLLLARISHPHVARLAPGGGPDGASWVDGDDQGEGVGPEGVLVLRVEAPLTFANADFVRTRVREIASATNDVRLVVLDGRATPSVDVTAASMLVQLRDDVHRLGARLVLAGPIGQVREVLALAESEGEPPVFPTIEAAIIAHAAGQTGGAWEREDRGPPERGHR